jgi:hypothetical protein
VDWLTTPHVRGLLSDLATGKLPLTHQALAAHPHWRATIYLRDLLTGCGVLPATDRQLLDYERWLHQRLHRLAGHPHQWLLRQLVLQVPAPSPRKPSGSTTPPPTASTPTPAEHGTATPPPATRSNDPPAHSPEYASHEHASPPVTRTSAGFKLRIIRQHQLLR